MSRQIIMCDLDGCVADFVKGFTTYAHSLWPDVPITHTAVQPKWDGFPGMDGKRIGQVWKEITHGDWFWKSLDPLEPAVMSQLNNLSYEADLYFTTNRHGQHVLEQSEDWLAEHGIDNPSVILVQRKGELARSLGATFMVDDKAGNAIYAAYHASPILKSYIVDRPYNQFDSGVVGSKVTRVSTVSQFVEDVWKAI